MDGQWLIRQANPILDACILAVMSVTPSTGPQQVHLAPRIVYVLYGQHGRTARWICARLVDVPQKKIDAMLVQLKRRGYVTQDGNMWTLVPDSRWESLHRSVVPDLP